MTVGGRLVAEGTADAPITFTPAAGEDVDPGVRGEMGDVMLLGRAPFNDVQGTTNVEGLEPTAESGLYGGDDATHDCGVVRHARFSGGGATFAGNEIPRGGLHVLGCARKPASTTSRCTRATRGRDRRGPPTGRGSRGDRRR